ncbi:uracil-DNA glycosylase family protein [Salinirubrum litoreum]|uniref:Uracil-DNA glycosylase family protein n=1 Tax=Salinirubrum litoreum TaxID=1126234 RepID=A0ABD5R7X3_9EURY
MENVTDRISNPFDMRPDCEQFVPGYGDANAEFHVIGDHPGVHGGADTGVPFTNEAGLRLQSALADAGLLRETGDDPSVSKTFLSYIHMCVSEDPPTDDDYGDMERFFDAELRAIAAHVLLPVGARATRHVLQTYSARAGKVSSDMDDLHGTEILGAGFLILPIKDPAEWVEGDHDRLVAGLRELQRTDFRREVDLGRFLAGDDPYMVR